MTKPRQSVRYKALQSLYCALIFGKLSLNSQKVKITSLQISGFKIDINVIIEIRIFVINIIYRNRIVPAVTIKGFDFFGAGSIRVATFQILLTKKYLKYFFFVLI